jgi:hypothetical protein
MTNRPKQKSYSIAIKARGGKISLGEEYAIAAYTGSKITWTYPGPFAVQFEPGTPFRVLKNKDSATMIIPKNARPFYPYKYTIAVFTGKAILILDPVIVRIPPDSRA